MSNRIVPQIYRAIIDDVIANVAVDFEEYGMDDDLLPMLQSKWEAKLLETRVAEFARAPGADDTPSGSQPSQHVPPNGHNTSAHPTQTGYDGLHVKAEPEDPLRLRGGAAFETSEVDGKTLSADGRPIAKPEPNAAGLLPGDEIIDSDLDDDDGDGSGGSDDDEAGGDVDIVFCVYDKVQRVKNKWKTVFKDGMIHVNGKDYLFAKCQGEFEW